MYDSNKISDAEIAKNIEKLFEQEYNNEIFTGIDMYVYFNMLCKNILEYEIRPDFEKLNYNGKDDIIAIIESGKTRKIMIYSQITGKHIFNSYDDLAEYKRKNRLWF